AGRVEAGEPDGQFLAVVQDADLPGAGVGRRRRALLALVLAVPGQHARKTDQHREQHHPRPSHDLALLRSSTPAKHIVPEEGARGRTVWPPGRTGLRLAAPSGVLYSSRQCQLLPEKDAMSDPHPVTIWTDGACLGNPGPGGYAAVLLCGARRVELSGGH